MKPSPLTLYLLRISDAANLVAYSLHLAARGRGLLTPAERVREAAHWQRHRLNLTSAYHASSLLS